MDTIGAADGSGATREPVAREDPARVVAARMAAAATAWLGALDPAQRAVAAGAVPSPDAGPDAERRRWFYTPTDHGGLTLGAQRPAQQRLAHQLVASGLSAAGYVTVAAIIGLENVLDYTERWTTDWGRERGRDPELYYLRVFGEPGGAAPWGWRFGGHHVSLNYLITDGAVRGMTPCFLGADPASAPLLGPAPLRPLAGAEDLARQLVRSLDAEQAGQAILLDRAPWEIIGGNRSQIADGDQALHLRDLWRGPFAEPGLEQMVTRIGDAAEQASGYDAAGRLRLALTRAPKGLPAIALDAGQRVLLRALLASYLGRVPDGLSPQPHYADDAALDAVHLAWAGPTEPGAPLYYRLQGPRLLIEYDNTQRDANHAHSVWRDPDADFGYDALGAHLTRHHRLPGGSCGTLLLHQQQEGPLPAGTPAAPRRSAALIPASLPRSPRCAWPAYLSSLATRWACPGRAPFPLSCGTTICAAWAGVSAGYKNLIRSTPAIPPPSCARMNTGTEDGAIPANVLENIRPIVMAGLAKLVDAVNQYAAPM